MEKEHNEVKLKMREDVKREVKKLLASGFNDLKVISFELGIPVEELQVLKNEVDRIKRGHYIESQSSSVVKMRNKYNRLLGSRVEELSNRREEASQQQYDMIDIVASKLQEKINRFENITEREKINELVSMANEVRKIKDFQWTLEQAVKMYGIISLISVPQKKSQESIRSKINELKNAIGGKLVEAVRFKVEEINNLEELEELNKRISAQVDSKIMSRISSDIQRKITSLRSKEAINRVKNDIPSEIRNIISRNC